MSIVRRVFFYLVSLATLGILAAGINNLLFLLLDMAFPNSDPYRSPDFIQTQLSLGLAMVIIGGPLWFFFWRSIQRQVDKNPAEIGSAIRKLFLNLIQLVAAIVALFMTSNVIQWLIAGAPRTENEAGSLAVLVVSIAIWYYHWRISEREGHPSMAAKTLRRWYIYFVSGWGLVWLAAGVIELVYLVSIYISGGGQTVVRGQFWSGNVRMYASWIVVGGLWWGFHWFRMAKGDIDSSLRRVYIYLLGIVSSSVTGLVALTFTLNRLFLRAFGADSSPAGDYFQFLGWTIPTIIVTVGIWVYHQSLAQEEAAQLPEGRLSSRRVHLYIMSFLGLGTMIAGAVVLLRVLLNQAVTGGGWQDNFSLGLALLLVGAPLWWLYWNQVIRLAREGGVAEWRARSRRIYLYGIIAAAILALAADLVNIIYQLLNGWLTHDFTINVFRSMEWSIQSLIVAAPVLVYHWRIAKADQRRGAESVVVRKSIGVMVGEGNQSLISRLEEKLGGKVRVLKYMGPETAGRDFTEEEITSLVNEIESSPAPSIMIIVQEGNILVLPYQEK